MFEGTNQKGKIDAEFEYGWYMESIELHCEGVEDKAREVLWGMFRGVLRFVTGYRWLDECPTGIDLKGINVTAVAQQNDAGKNHHDILGNWDIVFTFTPCGDSNAKVTTKNTLISIRKSMERYVRARYDLKEPEDLSLILLEQQRKELIEKHFVGIAD
ncbi:MAG: hypothetical protein NC123_11245 [Butyrivibrio sp.]|nr:hypothetical protein [Acetatifactor muris]MCM1560099.1 hypothetical protein [Butyrivibrio sp.]